MGAGFGNRQVFDRVIQVQTVKKKQGRHYSRPGNQKNRPEAFQSWQTRWFNEIAFPGRLNHNPNSIKPWPTGIWGRYPISALIRSYSALAASFRSERNRGSREGQLCLFSFINGPKIE